MEDQLLPKNSPDLTLLARVHLLPVHPLNRRRRSSSITARRTNVKTILSAPYKTAEWVIVVGDARYHFNQFKNVGFGLKRPVQRVANSSLFYEVKGRVWRSETNRRSFDDGILCSLSRTLLFLIGSAETEGAGFSSVVKKPTGITKGEKGRYIEQRRRSVKKLEKECAKTTPRTRNI